MEKFKRQLFLTAFLSVLFVRGIQAELDCDDDCYSIDGPVTIDQDSIIAEAEASVENPEETPLILDLPTAISLAMAENRTIANAFEYVQKSVLNIQLSESAFNLKITPSTDVGFIGGGDAGVGGTVGGSLDLCKKFAYGTRVSFRPYITKDANHFHTGVQAKIIQPLLKGFGKAYTLAPVYAAKFGNRSALRAAYTTGVDLVIRIVDAMYAIVRLEGILKFDTEAKERLKKLYQAVKIKERIGLADSLDTYRVETELKQAEDNMESSYENLLDARDRLREMLVLPLGQEISIRLSLDYSPFETDVEKSIETALNNRVEIVQANDRWRESQRLSSLAKNNLMPDLDLVMDFSNIGRDELFTRTFTNERDSRWGVGFMSSTDWDRTSQQVAYEQSLLSVTNAERSFEQVQDNVILDVKRSIRALKRADKKIALQEEQIKSSQGGVRLAMLKFERGLANNFDVVQAEKTLRQALTAHLSAIIEHKVGEYRFLSAIGLLVDKPQVN